MYHSNNTDKIKWSDEVLLLRDFVECYQLPQVIKIADGIYGDTANDTFSCEQVLKLHFLSTERKVLCHNEQGEEVHIPVGTLEEVFQVSEKYDTFFDLKQLSLINPHPQFVEVDGNLAVEDEDGDYTVQVASGEKIEIIKQDENIMKFSTEYGERFQLSLTNSYRNRFKVTLRPGVYKLSDLLPDNTGVVSPFCFEFVSKTGPHSNLSVLRCEKIYDEDIIIASCVGGTQSVWIFSIPKAIDISVRSALGTIKYDVEYNNFCQNINSFPQLEDQFCASRNGLVFRSASEVSRLMLEDKSAYKRASLKNVKHKGGKGTVSLDKSEEIRNLKSSTSSRSSSVDDSKFPNTSNDEKYVVMIGSEVENKPCSSSKTASIDRHTARNNASGDNTKADPNMQSIQDLCVSEVSDLLVNLSLSEHVQTFLDNQVDGFLLSELQEDELQDLGLNKFETKKLLIFLCGWRPKH